MIINAPASQQAQVAELIKQIDKEQTVPQHSKTYDLHYANASDTATVLQNVLAANASKGRGGTSSTQATGQQGFGPIWPLRRFWRTKCEFKPIDFDCRSRYPYESGHRHRH